jgi:thiamine monophosphate synthase
MALQVRNKHRIEEWQEIEPQLKQWLPEFGQQLLINGSHFPKINCGRHFPEIEMYMAQKTTRTPFLQGTSIHSHSALQDAETFGVEYVQYGAVFPTSKPVQPLGLGALQSICQASSLPVLAVGGISSLDQIKDCLSHGAYGVSIGSWRLNAQQPHQILKQIEQELHL